MILLSVWYGRQVLLSNRKSQHVSKRPKVIVNEINVLFKVIISQLCNNGCSLKLPKHHSVIMKTAVICTRYIRRPHIHSDNDSRRRLLGRLLFDNLTHILYWLAVWLWYTPSHSCTQYNVFLTRILEQSEASSNTYLAQPQREYQPLGQRNRINKVYNDKLGAFRWILSKYLKGSPSSSSSRC